MPRKLFDRAAHLRRFNRFYTRRIGVLRAGLLDSPYSLTEVRVLYEVAHSRGITAREIGEGLGLDRGYLSRILSRFQKLGFLTRKQSKEDGRAYHLELTPAGRKAFRQLNFRSQRQAESLIRPLGEEEQERLRRGLNAVEELLGGEAEGGKITLRRPRTGDLGYITWRHGHLYHQEYGWNEIFEGHVASLAAELTVHRDPQWDRGWIAECGGEFAGSVFIRREKGRLAKLHLLLVEPRFRGRGLGERLVRECITFCEGKGYRKISLWTNSCLTAARRIYEKTGFRLVKTNPHRMYGKQATGETWELALGSGRS